MKSNNHGAHNHVSLESLRNSRNTLAAAHVADQTPVNITPKEALRQLVELEPSTREFFGRLVVLNWVGGQVASQLVSAETVHALGAVLSIRTFDAQRPTAPPSPDPYAILECITAGSPTGLVEIQPSPRGLALVEAVLTGEDVSY